ncbi:hypothetical protein Q1695_005614 [Nippostrongylus brasiliensis]|nr:hypothetical protein Q1695_005614 [Nippostrongylus brasiliensis]
MSILKPGAYRTDLLVLLAYQLCQFFSTQQLYPILLNYVPPVKCIGEHCFKVSHKCYEHCADCPDVCYNGTNAEKEACIADSQPYFYSSAMEYRPFCDEFYRAFSSTTIQYLGVLLGNCFAGILADRYGRRLILLLALAFGIPDLVLSAVFVSLPVFYAFRFLVGISIAATMTVGWAYCAEMISARHRFKLRTFTSWTNGRLIMTALTHLAYEWRLATYYHAILSLGAVLAVFILPESPLWLKSKGYYSREADARKRLALINGLEYKKENESRSQAAQPSRLTLLDVFKDPDLRTSFLVLCVMWFCAGLSMYMIDLNGEDMTKNFWLGQYLSAALASIIRVVS